MIARMVAAITVGAAFFCGHAAAADEPVDYLKQIRPILAERCFACHGAVKQKGKLRLDTAAALAIKGGESGSAIRPGDPARSLLLQRVTAADEADRMPPEGKPLTPTQIALLKRWIAQGAQAPANEEAEKDPSEHWAFKPCVRPAVPVVANAAWVRNPLDAFIAIQHEKNGLKPQPEAPREILIRRLYLDLVGMPPSPEEWCRLDQEKDEGWYNRLAEQLLADPRYGERWGRHWMDIWRYSDWWGLGAELRNSQRHIWHWRDWIIESLNADLPYDEMVRQMLAADELYPNDLGRLRATGYLARNYFLFNRNQWMDETVEHVSKAFLGLTMNCCKCHDHKYDPFLHADYYRMRAFFEPYHVRNDVLPGEPDLARDAIPRVFDGLPDAPTYLFVRGDETKPDKSAVITPGVPAILAFKELAIQPVKLPVEAWHPERRPWVLDNLVTIAKKGVAAAEAAVTSARAKLTKPGANCAAAEAELKVAELGLLVAKADLQGVESRAEALRAQWQKAGSEAERAKAVEAIQAERQAALLKARHNVAAIELRLLHSPADKKELIKKELSLAREGVVKSERLAADAIGPKDAFTGVVGAKWVATRFLNSTADDPVATFQPQSTGRRKALAEWITDPKNPLTARVAVNHLWTRHLGAPLVPTVFDFGRKGTPPVNPQMLDWLASEFVASGWSMKHMHRLIVTSATYRMSSSSAGAETNVAKDADNKHWWRRSPIRLESQAVRDSILALAGTLEATRGGPPVSSQGDSKRRSIYLFHSNNERNLFLTTFDEASVKECYRREQSIVPQQALALANSEMVLDAARKIAERLSADNADDVAFVRGAFRNILGISASEREMTVSLRALDAWRKLPDGAVARSHLIWALINHNDFVTLR
jgi:mono/diheme cytochrome c family protein